jgi:CubicO group peptidase (beta-lactamase class C family)
LCLFQTRKESPMCRSTKWSILLVLLIVVLTACAPAATPVPLTATNPPPTDTPAPPTATSTLAPTDVPKAPTPDIQTLNAELDTMLQKVTKAGVFSGSVLVAQNGQVILSKGYGFADREKKISNAAQTKFSIASITKQFTAMAIMMLQEQGKLKVQDKICAYLTDCPEAWKSITIDQLLTHTSGIPDTPWAFYMQEITSSLPLEQSIADAKTKPLDFQPGEKFSYDNLGFVLLGKIIESVSGQSYEAFLQTNIFEPLQMTNTGFDPARTDLAVGYEDQVYVADPINMWVSFSAGALYSSVEDLYHWDQALYTDKLVPQQVLDTMFTAHVLMPDSDGWGYGYGWMIGPDTPRLIMHYGGFNGFTSVIKRYPDDIATIIILTNQENVDPDSTGDLIAKKLFGK